MPKARKSQISLSDTAYYHCISRCVRRAFLCGKDSYSGQSYEHRRQWVEERIHELSQVFAIDVCAYAVMSNHTHLVLHINQQKALDLSSTEVIARWHKLFKGTLLTQKRLDNQPLSVAQAMTVEDTVNVWRKRLYCVSWFMRSLNEYIARLANKEDDCTGRFWEGRFKSQALLGDAAIATCMAYVDLNPIRANMAKTPQSSAHTSIQYRINAAMAGKQPKYLFAFTGQTVSSPLDCLPFSLSDYLHLIDNTATQLIDNTNALRNSQQPAILQRFNIETTQWHELITSFENCFAQVAGNTEELLKYKQSQNLKRLVNLKNAKRLFG